MESRNVETLKSIWPTLQGAQEDAVRQRVPASRAESRWRSTTSRSRSSGAAGTVSLHPPLPDPDDVDNQRLDRQLAHHDDLAASAATIGSSTACASSRYDNYAPTQLHSLFLLIWLVLRVGIAAAQDRPSTLSTLFEDIYGPRGLVLNSDDVQLDGTNHAAHFNSAFQSEFRLMNVALTSQLATVPLPSPASGFTYTFDPGTGTFARSTRSFGPILAERGETIGRGKIAFGYTYQFFSFDHLDGLSLVERPGRLHARQSASSAAAAPTSSPPRTRSRRPSASSPARSPTGVTDRIDLSLAVPVVQTRLSLLSNATIHRIGTGSNLGVHYFRDPDAIGGYGSTRQYFAEGTAAGVGDLVARVKSTLMRERHARLRRRPRRAAADRRRQEPARLGCARRDARSRRSRPRSAAFAPHANVAYQWNGESAARRQTS